jgi:hypothetical protein
VFRPTTQVPDAQRCPGKRMPASEEMNTSASGVRLTYLDSPNNSFHFTIMRILWHDRQASSRAGFIIDIFIPITSVHSEVGYESAREGPLLRSSPYNSAGCNLPDKRPPLDRRLL